MDFPPQLQSALGLGVFVAIAWVLSENRRAFPWQTVVVGIGLQIGLAAVLLGIAPVREALLSLNVVVDAIQAVLVASGFEAQTRQIRAVYQAVDVIVDSISTRACCG